MDSSRNPIQSLANDSFLSLDRLEHLDLSNMKMESIEVHTIFKISVFYNTRLF